VDILRIGLISAFLLGSNVGLCGAWDTGSFDNDDALDWVWLATEGDDLSPVSEAFEGVLSAPGYVQAPDASIAIAAAEVVAALKGEPSAQLPEELSTWIESQDLELDPALIDKAKKAIALIEDGKKSELAQLWSESGDLADQWRAQLAELSQRLE